MIALLVTFSLFAAGQTDENRIDFPQKSNAPLTGPHKRRKLRGRGRGQDHVTWPNHFFATRGLLSLQVAHAEALSALLKDNHRLESRVREIRTHGSEGGGAG